MITARQAFTSYSTGVEAIQKEILNQISKKQVAPVFRGDLESGKQQKKYVEFVTKYGLVTDDAAAKAQRGAGLGRKSHIPDVDKLTANGATAIKNAVKAVNDKLSGQKAPYRIFFYAKKFENAAEAAAASPKA